MLILQLSYSAEFAACQNSFLINFCEHPAHTFQTQRCCYQIDNAAFGVFKLGHPIHVAHLRRFIDCFYVETDTFGIVGIFRIVAVKISKSLLKTTLPLPMSDKRINLLKVHKRNIINISVFLAIKDNSRRRALIAHSLRIRWMLFAIKVNFIRQSLTPSTILTFLMRSMAFSTNFPHFT